MKIIISIIAILFTCSAMAHDHGKENLKTTIEKVVKVEIGKKGFVPNPVKAKKGENLVLNITRTTKKTCMTELKHPTSGKLVKLPLNEEVRFEVGKLNTNKKIDLLCGMDMNAGSVVISE